QKITGTIDYSGFKSVDFIVEAIVEDLEIKKTVFKELENNIREDAIVVTNTSSLLVNDMAKAFRNPQRFVGMHFFNPVHMMPLVEVIRGKDSTDEAVATTFQLAKALGKTPVVVSDGPGFLVNRLLVPYMVEAVSLLEEGHGIQKIDKAMLNFGMPMGPIELFDEVGIDVAFKVAKILGQSMGDRMAESDILENMVKDGKIGKKSKVGFYKYDGKKKIYDSNIESYISVKNKTTLSEDQLIQRMVYPMINEATRCLDEKIVDRPKDVDLGMIFGTGFAPFRGGLLNYADSEGIEKVSSTLQSFSQEYGSRFELSDALKKMAKENKNFYEYWGN
ncbi:MAG: fatty-acid oxidation protein subunit alpha, partial [Calditrichia bacterium]|nr:fatty-acid oxidation protein subunit alpha [Calditrichia bacterium]